MDDSERIAEVCDLRNELRTSKQFYPTVVGEWTLAAPQGDNGRHRNLPDIFRFDNDNRFSRAFKNFLAINFRVQQAVFEQGA